MRYIITDPRACHLRLYSVFPLLCVFYIIYISYSIVEYGVIGVSCELNEYSRIVNVIHLEICGRKMLRHLANVVVVRL